MEKIIAYKSFDGAIFETEAACKKRDEMFNPILVIENWIKDTFQYDGDFLVVSGFTKACENYHDTATEIYRCLQSFCTPDNAVPECRTPMGLFNYSIKHRTFGDVCTVYAYDVYSDSYVNIFPADEAIED